MALSRDENGKKRIAIGCQGAGADSAFTAGALKRLMRDEQHEIVALSGTSGGAICAFLAWYALLENDRSEAAAKATELLESFWRDNSASEPFARFFNDLAVWTHRWQGAHVLLSVSPYNMPVSSLVRDQLRKMLKKQRVDLENLTERLDSTSPVLQVGAIDIVTGHAKAFDSRNDEISVDAILASAAVPPLFTSMHVKDGVYWDALFCQNPPIRELPRLELDEIWVIKVVPDSLGHEPKSLADMMDLRNGLSGNIALHKELYIVEKINELVDELGEGENREDKRLRLPGKGKEYKHIEVRLIELSTEMAQTLDAASKMDRSPSFIRKLMNHGEERAEEFLRN